jgi:hypothetical protein
MRRALALLVAVGSFDCGYRSLSAATGTERLHVTLASSKVPDAVASDEVLAGLREELARAGALAPGDGYPRCEVEVLRADEASEGIAAATSPGDGTPLAPQSRATRVGIVARAWVIRQRGKTEHERDTGDLRSLETVAVAGDARGASFRHGEALRTAGRRAGKRLAARILGLPAPSED